MILFLKFSLFTTMLCSFCGKSAGNLRTYIKHVCVAHRSEPYFNLMCGIEGCPQTFKRYSSFSSHIYRKHKQALVLEGHNINSNNSTYIGDTCTLCEMTFSPSELLAHLKRHIKHGDKVVCPYHDCSNEYTVLSSFTSHLCRNHPSFQEHFGGRGEATTETMPGNRSESDSLQLQSAEDLEESNFQENGDDDKESFFKSLLQSLLKLQEHQRLPISTVDKVVEEMNLTTSLSYQHTELAVLSILRKVGVDTSIQEKVSQEFESNIFSKSIVALNTAYKRKSVTEKYFPVIKPITISLGVNSKHKIRSFQYVPILDTLRSMLKSDNILSAVMKGANLPGLDDNLLSDYSDGNYYKSNTLFADDLSSIQVILYYDEFEVVNPLGSKRGKQKLAAVYMAIGNLNVFQRSNLKCIQLCLLCAVVDVKEFGLNMIFESLIFDLKILENEGIFVEEINQNLKGTVSYICGDNLGSHQIGGFMESFGPNVRRICRFCMASSAEIQEHFDPAHFLERNVNTYNFHIDEINKDPTLIPHYGVKVASIFNELNHFHVSRGLPADIMHDLLEGCAKKEIPIILKELTKTHITERELLLCVQLFEYGRYDIENKPAEPKTLGGITTQSAAQMWTLVRFLPIMIGHFIPEENKVWELLLLLKDITEIVMSPVIHKKMCPFLQMLITDHHSLFKEVFPEIRLTPKHHYLIHYPEMILRFGPLRSCWCMRFEAKHSYFKQIALSLKNYKNLPCTLANRHQNLQSYVSSSDKGYNKADVEVTSCKSALNLTDFVSIKLLLEENGIDIADYVSVKKVVLKGIAYHVGSYIITDFVTDEPQMSRITNILMKNCTIIVVGNDFRAVLNSHFRAYELVALNRTSLYDVKKLVDPLPLDAYRIRDKLLCVLKHFVLNTSEF